MYWAYLAVQILKVHTAHYHQNILEFHSTSQKSRGQIFVFLEVRIAPDNNNSRLLHWRLVSLLLRSLPKPFNLFLLLFLDNSPFTYVCIDIVRLLKIRHYLYWARILYVSGLFSWCSSLSTVIICHWVMHLHLLDRYVLNCDILWYHLLFTISNHWIVHPFNLVTCIYWWLDEWFCNICFRCIV